ncbi:hypothetical protein H9Y04_06585 [Streptomyces sp. TRM66268-LWL]|uniref:Uncharacterized protein n=1 Tax=Streptomyces polyasparticus TaxID=2767826 RepID=A0ABR7SD20_9ACTN|nr:hypothetical protein [Streptomyces polyasparticus]MBC9712238.1 hypothetical protein [Streptomyces polyasparticus]
MTATQKIMKLGVTEAAAGAIVSDIVSGRNATALREIQELVNVDALSAMRAINEARDILDPYGARARNRAGVVAAFKAAA